jgi:hypothetical protein
MTDPVAAAVLADPVLGARLGRHDRPDAFAAELRAVAAELGLDARGRDDPHGGAATPLDAWPGPGWRPARPAPDGVEWAWFGESPPAAPFYQDDAARAVARPLSRAFRPRTGWEALLAGAGDAPDPDGLVFHMSRCGSTLVAQMLAAVPGHLVLSEPQPLDAVVLWAVTGGATPEQQVAAVRATVAALGRGAARRRFLKLDGWHARALPLFRAAFPRTPWAFLYRDPVEVLVSQMRQRGLQTVPGLLPAAALGFAPEVATSEEDYVARVLAAACGAALAEPGGIAVAYPELPDAVADRIAPHFGFVPDASETAAMARAAARDAKAPDARFAPDGAAKRAEATPAIRAAAAAHLAPLHAALEAWRTS